MSGLDRNSVPFQVSCVYDSPSVFDAKAVWFLHALAGNALSVAKVAAKWHALAENKGDLVWLNEKANRSYLTL